MPFKNLRVNEDPRGVLEVCLARPEVRNAFNSAVIADLEQVFAKEVQRPSVRAVVLRGEGAAFCAGGDLQWLKQAVELPYAKNLGETRRLSKLFDSMNQCPKPLIGAVHGFAIAGGVGLVSVCDHVVATRETQFSLSEVRLGIVPACIGPFVIAKVGLSQARSLFVMAERFGAERAKAIGLVHDVVQDNAAMDLRVENLVAQVLECGPTALKEAKQLCMDLGWPERRAKVKNVLERISVLLAKLRVSPEGQEGIRAFLEKRKPNWPILKKAKR